MEFGKLADVSKVDFTLPHHDPRNEEHWSPSDLIDDPHLYIGLPRWASKVWLGDLYPNKTRQADYLRHYAQTYNTIELNSTHYRIPKHEIVQRWRDMTPSSFRFCPKIPQSISHYHKLLASGQLSSFIDAIAQFEDKLGCSFVQLPHYFGPALMTNLVEFLNQWPESFPLAIEFRNESWFDHQLLIGEAYELLARKKVSCVITDVAGRRDVSHNSLPVPIAMLRFVANGLHETDYIRFQAWQKRIDEWRKSGLSELYFFVHQPEDDQTHTFGKFVIDQFQRQFGFSYEAELLEQEAKKGNQMSLF